MEPPLAEPPTLPLRRQGARREADLVARGRTGDRTAIEELLRAYAPQIERICRRLCGPDDSYEDVLQETYLGIIRNLGSFRGDSAFVTWAFTICRTYRGRYLRRQRREAWIDGLDVADTPSDVDCEAHAAGQQLGEVIHAAIERLSATDRSILVLRDVQGMSALEVAARVGLTVPAVKTRLHRARLAMRARLSCVHRQLRDAA